MTTPKDELSEAIRESVAQLRDIVRRGSDDSRLSATHQLINLAGQYPTLAEVFGDPEDPGGECETCESLCDELEAAQAESARQFERAYAAEHAIAQLRDRITALEFDAKQSQEAVDDAFKTVHRWLDELDVPRTKAETDDGGQTELSLKERVEWLSESGARIDASSAYQAVHKMLDGYGVKATRELGNGAIITIPLKDRVASVFDRVSTAERRVAELKSEYAAGNLVPRGTSDEHSAIEIRRLKRKLAKARERRDFFSAALTAVLRHEGAPPGGVNAFVDAIKGRDMRIAGLLEKLDRIGAEFASKEAAITVLVNAQDETRAALDAGRAYGGRTIADRVNNLVKRRDEEEARLKGLLATAPAELSQKDGELRRAYMSIGHAVHVLNEAGFECGADSMGKAIVDLARALVVAKGELSAVRK